MTKKDFAFQCSFKTTGVIRVAAAHSYINGKEEVFVQEMLEQDSDDGSRSGTKRVLGPTLYKELQKFKSE